MQGAHKAIVARAFLEGMPPTWSIAASEIPVWLDGTNGLMTALRDAIARKDRMFLVHGQSGSGKTTALMQALLRISKDVEGFVLYELRDDVPSLRAALELIRRLHSGEHVVVYVGDAFMYGDALGEDAARFPAGSLTLVTSARSGEWRDHIQRRVGEFCTSYQYQRFAKEDFVPLIDRLAKYVPAPRFKKMPQNERIERLRSSRSQLLIALRETTESAKFTEVITGEFLDLPDDDCRVLALIAGIPTIARTGISKAAAREAFGRLRKTRTFDESLRALEGIVSTNSSDRLIARHEAYVRHIVEHVADIEIVLNVMIEILRTYTKFAIPITRTVKRQDSLLFRFLLNHNFVHSLGRGRGGAGPATRLYKEFEVDFQLDGHYWLQYGQFLVQKDDLEPALDVLNKSIQAYPDNPYALHAYADLQLQVAERRAKYDSRTIELIDEAVGILEAQHLKSIFNSDQYPIVTLCDKHVGALVKHGQLAEAREVARKYFRQIDEFSRQNAAESVLRARERLAVFASTGEWHFRPPSHDRNGLKRRRRH